MSGGVVIGRADELERLEPILRGGRAGLIIGEAGVGKTRLALEVLQRCGGRGRIALRAACLPLASRLPLLPIVDLVRALLIGDDGPQVGSVLDDCPSFVRDDIGQLVPELGSTGWGQPDEWQQQRLFAALVFFFRAVEARCGLTVVVEDVHWSDQTTRDFLTYLVAHLQESGPGVIMTARSGDSDRDEMVREWLPHISMDDAVTHLVLEPFSADEVADLAQSILGSPPSAELVADLCRRTGGNAFFVEQLLATDPAAQDVQVPDPLAQLLRGRAAGLPVVAQRTLEALAVASRPMVEDELATITGQDTTRVRDAVRALLARQLARREGEGFTTRHALLAEALAGELLPGDAAELHAQVAAALLERHDPRLAAELATHWAAAGDARAELAARVEAAQYAETIFAFRQAAQHWERALELAETMEADQVGSLALCGIEAWNSAGETLRGFPLVVRGLTATGSAGHRSQVWAGLKLREVLLRYPDSLSHEIEELTAVLGEVAGLASPTDQIAALTRLYFDHRAVGQNHNGLPFLHRAVEIGASQQARGGDYVDALCWLAYEQGLVGDVAAAQATLEQAREVAQEGAGPLAVAALAGAETRFRLVQNRLEDVVTAGRSQLDLLRCQGFGHTNLAGLVAVFMAEALLGLGDVDGAAEIVDTDTNTDTDGRSVTLDSVNLDLARCRVDVARGELNAAAARLEEIYAVADHSLEVACILSRIAAEIALWAGEPDAAVAALQPILPRLAGSDEERLGDEQLAMAMRGCADLAEAASARRDRAAAEDAKQLREDLVAMLGRMHTDPFADHPFFVTGPAHGADWEAETKRSLLLDTAPDWDRAAHAWEALHRHHRAAYARWRQAQALLKQGHRPQGVAALKTAWQLAHQHQPLSAAIAHLARMARIDLSAAQPAGHGLGEHQPAPPSVPYHLTPRELDVLRLLVGGLTNAQIGAQLYLSPKTVSVHVTAILRKLQATNRVHAATIAQRAGIAGT